MKKDILIAVYSMEIGGIERSLINMLKNFDYEKYNVDLFIYEHTGELMKDIPIEVNILPENPKISVFRKPIKKCVKEKHISTSIIRVVSKVISVLQSKKRSFKEGHGYIQMQLSFKLSSYVMPKFKKEYEAVISYSWPHEIISKNVKASNKIAWIHTDYSKLEINHSIDLKSWKKFDNIVSISEDVTKSFLSVYPSLKERIIMCENISDPSAIKELAFEKVSEFDSNSFNILSVGRLSYVKGFDLAVKALKILHDKGYDKLKWYVIGYGGYEGELRKLIKEQNLEEQFILLGKKTNPYPYIKKCDIFVQPSRYEGKAVTVTEAKILTRPIIITNYPTATSQIEQNKEGSICGLTPKDIAEKIEEIYKNESLREQQIQYLQGQEYGNREELKNLYAIL